MKYKHPIEVELKGVIETITQQTRELFSIKQFQSKIEDLLKDQYTKGITEIDKQLKPSVNTITPLGSTRQLQALYDYVQENLQDQVDQIGNQLRQEVQRGLQNNETKDQIIARVKTVFKDDKGVLNRLKVIIRTESNRAATQGRLEAAEQVEATGIKLKKWLQVVPYMKGVSSPFCNTPAGNNSKLSANGKYGSKEKAIPLDQEFVVKADNKTVRAMGSPFHPNCRTTLRIVREEEI